MACQTWSKAQPGDAAGTKGAQVTAETNGDARVDAVVDGLTGVEELDLPAQLTAFERAQAQLAAVLDADVVAPDAAAAADAAPIPT